MAGFQGGQRSPSNDNGRVSGGSGGPEHRYSFPGVDAARWQDATRGSTDTDSRWSGAIGQTLTYPNTMGVARGTMIGPVVGNATDGFMSNGTGKGVSANTARTSQAQAYNDARSCYDGVVANGGNTGGTNTARTSAAQAINDRESLV